jgi:hypothetical protein
VPGLDQAAAPALQPLYAAARTETLGHVDQLKIVQPEKAEESAQELLHAVCPMIA